jgi:hypothetical protein
MSLVVADKTVANGAGRMVTGQETNATIQNLPSQKSEEPYSLPFLCGLVGGIVVVGFAMLFFAAALRRRLATLSGGSDKSPLTTLGPLVAVVMAGWLAVTCALHATMGTLGGSAAVGDSFGAVNALFSGLAFGGVVIALVIQSRQLRLQVQEQRQTQIAVRDQAESIILTTYMGIANEYVRELSKAAAKTDSGIPEDGLYHSDHARRMLRLIDALSPRVDRITLRLEFEHDLRKRREQLHSHVRIIRRVLLSLQDTDQPLEENEWEGIKHEVNELVKIVQAVDSWSMTELRARVEEIHRDCAKAVSFDAGHQARVARERLIECCDSVLAYEEDGSR